jgi:hypothetical protein
MRALSKDGIMEYWKNGERSGEEWKYGILEGWVMKCDVYTQNSIIPIFHQFLPKRERPHDLGEGSVGLPLFGFNFLYFLPI